MMLRNLTVAPESNSYQKVYSLPTQTRTLNEYSCKTIELNQSNHSSGFKVNITLIEHHGTYRTGETIHGKVDLTRNELTSHGSIKSLIIRGYWQSTTLYSQHSSLPVNSKNNSSKGLSGGSEKVLLPEKEVRYEYHRGYLLNGGEGTELWEERGYLDGIQREVDGDFPLIGDRSIPQNNLPLPPLPPLSSSSSTLDESTGSRSFEFKFLLPTKTRSHYANPSAYPPSDRGELINFPRCPPPSYSSDAYSNGGVEWVIEALLVLEDPNAPILSPLSPDNNHNEAEDEPPSFPTTLRESSSLDSHGLIIGTPLLLVKRITFPFEPLDKHSDDFYSGAIGSSAIPSIGRDPREELGGTPRVSSSRDVGGLSKEIVEREGGKVLWDTYEKDYIVKSTLGRDVGILRSEVSFPISLSLTRYATSLPLLFAFSYTPLSTKSFLKSSNATSIYLDKLTVILYERILTRSGSAIRSSMVLKEVRKESYDLGSISISSSSSTSTATGINLGSLRIPILESTNTRDSGSYLISSSSGGDSDSPASQLPQKKKQKGLKLPPSLPSQLPNIISLKLSLDLQTPSPTLSSPPFISRPLKTCGNTFRVPNLEREYFIGVRLEIGDKKGTVQICRVPMEVKVGDDDVVPPWEGNVEFQDGLGLGDRIQGQGRTERVVVVGEEEDGLPGYV